MCHAKDGVILLVFDGQADSVKALVNKTFNDHNIRVLLLGYREADITNLQSRVRSSSSMNQLEYAFLVTSQPLKLPTLNRQVFTGTNKGNAIYEIPLVSFGCSGACDARGLVSLAPMKSNLREGGMNPDVTLTPSAALVEAGVKCNIRVSILCSPGARHFALRGCCCRPVRPSRMVEVLREASAAIRRFLSLGL